MLGRRLILVPLFPEQGFAVMLPNSANPNPIVGRMSESSAFLSNPAERPTGFLNFIPRRFWDRIGFS